ncbi:MAG: hypothetical protein ACU85V_18945 [Gammaproteobacteria bacterium]
MTAIADVYRTYIVPAAVFQGVIVGGGYGTGREIVEYVSRHGAGGGLLACLIVAFGFALVLGVSFAFAVRFAAHDYRHFLKRLLGRAWVVYELLLVVLLVIVVAVVASAAGAAAHAGFGMPAPVTTSAVLVIVVVLNFFGRALVEQALVLWSGVLTVALAAFLLAAFLAPAGEATAPASGSAAAAALSGAQFAVYNSALIPVLLYCVADVRTTAVAWRAGVLAGLAGALPALLLHLVFMRAGVALVDEPVPTLRILYLLELNAAAGIYFCVLFGTIVLTAAGVLQGVNERLDGWRDDAALPPWPRAAHAAVAGGIVIASVLLARFGIVDLVARGYGALSWAFFGVFTLPLLTVGLVRVLR